MSPFPISALKDGVPLKTEWFFDFVWSEWVHNNGLKLRKIEIDAPSDADAFVIDRERTTLDVNRKNDSRRTSGLFPGMEPLELKLLRPFQDARRNTIGVLPWAGWNAADKTMLGLVFYNPPFPPAKCQVYLLPGYALGSKKWVGLGSIKYHFFPGGIFPKLDVSVSAKSFDVDYNATNDYYTRFYRFVPQVRAELRSGSIAFRHALNFRTLFVGKQAPVFNMEGDFLAKTWRKYTIHELRYEGGNKALPNPFQFQLALETQQYKDVFDRNASYVRSTAEWRQHFYYKPKRKVTARFFAGYFLKNTLRNASINEPFTALSLNPQAFNDYKFDHTYIDRTGVADDILGRRVSQSEGGFKGAFGAAFAGVLGNSNNYILALNLKADLPQKLPWGIPLKPYFDIGYFDDATPLGNDRPLKEQLLWNGGMMLELFKGSLEVYFPLFSSETLKRQYCEQGGGTNNSAIFCGGDYRKMISWSMKINGGEPLELLQGILR